MFQIVNLVKLPPDLASHPFLQEFYGTVEWSVRAVFTNYIGWFSGKVGLIFVHCKSYFEITNFYLLTAAS